MFWHMDRDPLDQQFALFLRERRFLHNCRPASLDWHAESWRSFRNSATQSLRPSDVTKALLEDFVYAQRERGVKPVTVNTRLCSLNAFFRWLHERGEIPQVVRMRRLKVEKRLKPTLDAPAIHAMVGYRPPTAVTLNPKHVDGPRRGQKVFALWRIHALACALLDTGCRVQELLDAEVGAFDFEDLLLTVVGKGDKQRRVPFSIELRKILYRYRQQREVLGVPASCRLMFPEHEGGPWDQRNALRSFYVWQDRLGLSPRVGFHRLRHTFATEYLRRGGDLVRLSRSLGHTQITTTMHYLQLLTEDLSREHVKVSLLSRGR
jgi:integrase/recombinase XerD